MKKIILSAFCILNIISNYALCEVISGQIDKYDTNYQNQVIDSKNKQGLNNAKITIPDLHYTTYSDKNGNFRLNADVKDKTVLFVEKDGYKVFSLTIDNSVLKSPLKIGIEETSPFDLQITDGIIHLGDNMFSENSANSRDFKSSAKGHFMSQNFKRPNATQKQDVVLRIGTVIGLDTQKAKAVGQNRIAKVYSSPAEIFVNGNRIGQIELNGDNKEFIIPKGLLKDTNELVVKTGRNLFQYDYADYDDMELANIRVEVKEKTFYARQ